MRTRFLMAFALGVLAAGSAGAIELKSDDDKTIYALGVLFARNLDGYVLSAEELEVLKAGLTDAATKQKLQVEPDTQMMQKIQDFGKARQAKLGEEEKKAAEPFLAKMAEEKGAQKLPSGLIYIEVKPGTGDSPAATDTVKVHYHGTLRDGSVFDSSVQRGTPASFPLNRVIPCWTEGLQKMKVGGKSKLVCPASIAYGDRGSPPKIRPGAPLVFDIELLEVVKPAAAPTQPAAPTPPAAH